MEETKELKLKPKQKRKAYFEFMKKLMKGRYKQPKFVYLGEEITTPTIILSNHEGTDAPMSLEIYWQNPVRMWGAHEMNENLANVYKYLSKVFYHQKRHWNLFLARLFCIIAAPCAWLFYRGLNLIPAYKDIRFKHTLQKSLETLEKENGELKQF